MSDTPHPDKIFQVEEDASSSHTDSLRAYIAKHLKTGLSPADEAGQPPQPPRASASFVSETAYQNKTHPDSTPAAGMVLHHLDSQLAESHLERYLPTASIRYYLGRERLDNELKAIYKELSHYRQAQGDAYSDKITALEVRAQMLQRKIFELDHKLSALNPFQSLYGRLQQLLSGEKGLQSAAPETTESGWTLFPNRAAKTVKEEMAQLNGELKSLNHILEQQLHDPCFSAEQLGSLVNQYDAQLKRAEKLADSLRRSKGFSARLSTWYRNLSTNEQA